MTTAEALALLLSRAGLLGDEGFNTEAELTNENLQAFAAVCKSNRVVLEEIFKTQFRRDIGDKPVTQLNVLLKLLGLALTQTKRVKDHGVSIRFYGLDKKRFHMMGRLIEGVSEKEVAERKAVKHSECDDN